MERADFRYQNQEKNLFFLILDSWFFTYDENLDTTLDAELRLILLIKT